MIIKSMTRKDKQSFSQLVQYITQEAKVGRTDPLLFSHNLYGETPDEVAEEMRQNYSHRQRIKEDENSLLHYVLSFHKDDTEVLSRSVLTDIVGEFVDEFNPNGMTFGALHSDQEHYHCHLVLCANEVGSNELIYKKRYLKKEQRERPIEERSYKERTFEESKNRVRSYARLRAKQYAKEKSLSKEHQAEGLFYSFNENYNRNRKQADRDEIRSRNIKGLKQQRSRKGTLMQLLSADMLNAFNQTGSFEAFIRAVQKKHTVYRTTRGTINGIAYNGKNYRFTSLLTPDEAAEFKKMRSAYNRTRTTQKTRRARERGGYGRDRR